MKPIARLLVHALEELCIPGFGGVGVGEQIAEGGRCLRVVAFVLLVEIDGTGDGAEVAKLMVVVLCKAGCKGHE